MRESFLRPTESKPTSFYRDAFRHLYLNDQSHGLRRSHKYAPQPAHLRRSATLLSPPSSRSSCRGCLEDLFGGGERIDLTESFFASITHLDVFDNMERNPNIPSQIASLPALTHLCLDSALDEETLPALSSDCRDFQILVHLSLTLRPTTSMRAIHPSPILDM
ncbi:hypothetical protein DFH07DRAFT_577307 [Mycena maculata]|uniref:Uncharacterized protein n=1 Tax=Mycena maculata TaxID=230809 RepID=A0AAD7IRR3_9AGAR|nr:hypothetical protein DFH07DRAFT_577307 [Mycena maculata]